MKQPELPDMGDKTDVARHRLQVAKEDLQAADVLVEAKSYRGAKIVESQVRTKFPLLTFSLFY